MSKFPRIQFCFGDPIRNCLGGMSETCNYLGGQRMPGSRVNSHPLPKTRAPLSQSWDVRNVVTRGRSAITGRS